ncbi:MAG: 50S ribosomal protein L17 [Patescibacteria group bacterium]
MRKFGRVANQRRAFKKSLIANLILHEKIKTTEARAKEIRSLTERLVTYAKKNNLAGRRQITANLPADAAKKLAKEIAPRFVERQGGYLRLTKLGRRSSDGAKMTRIEFLK